MAFPGIWGVGRWALSVQVVRARGKEKEEKNKEIGGEQVGRRFLLSWTELTTWYLCIILCKMNSTVRDSASPLQLTDATVGRRWEACSLCLAAPVPSPGPSAWSRHQNLAQHWKFRCAEADRQKTDRHRDKKKWQGCSCNRRQKSMTSCTWDATHPRALDLGTPEGREYSTVGVRSKQYVRKEDRTCMRCVTRSLTSRAYFCRSAKQGGLVWLAVCLSVNQE